jgi:hypothetical protein
MSMLVSRSPRRAASPIRSELTLGRLRRLRAWLDESPSHEPTPVAGHMYGLLLRPATTRR